MKVDILKLDEKKLKKEINALIGRGKIIKYLIMSNDTCKEVWGDTTEYYEYSKKPTEFQLILDGIPVAFCNKLVLGEVDIII